MVFAFPVGQIWGLMFYSALEREDQSVVGLLLCLFKAAWSFPGCIALQTRLSLLALFLVLSMSQFPTSTSWRKGWAENVASHFAL